jgi:hypothetical protein
MSSCQFNDIFGKPHSGVHRYRIFNMAIVDILSTFLGALVISYFCKVNYLATLFILFLFGIILHRIFCVKTTIDKLITNTFDANIKY